MPPKKTVDDRRDYWAIKDEPYFSNKGLYVISIPTLAKRGIYKVGYSGISLKNRLKQFHDILSPSFGERLLVYGLVIPKKGKDVPVNTGKPPAGKKRAPAQKHVRGEELRTLEGMVHKAYQKENPSARLKYPYSQRYSEWIKEKNLQHLFDFLHQEIFEDGKLEYKNNFYIHKL